jgi:hypothetical protein
MPDGSPEWKEDNPHKAETDFLARHPDFRQETPRWTFQFGPLTQNVTYSPDGWLRRIADSGDAPVAESALTSAKTGGPDNERSLKALAALQDAYRKRLGIPCNELELTDLHEIPEAIKEIRAASDEASVEPRIPARILTPGGRWAYAAVVPLAIPAGLNGPIWVRILATVVRGQAAFGLFESTGVEFQDRALIGTTSGTQKIFLEATNPGKVAYLIIQNASPDAKPADLLIEELSVLRLGEAPIELP